MIRFSAVAILFALAGTLPVGAPPRSDPQAVVHGAVTDQTDAPFSGAKVHFTHDGRDTLIRTSRDGTYAAKLTPGIYSVRVESPGFCDGLRGEFLARGGSEIDFDFVLTVAAVTEGIVTNADGHYTRFTGVGGCYESEELAAPVKDGARPLVQYGRRVAEGDVVRYYSGANGNSVVYMYDLLTVKATALEYSAKDNSIAGSGRVMWQDEKTAKGGTQIHVTFSHGKPQITLLDY
jgi:hypothetical protein